MKRKKDDSNYKIVFLFLERMPVSIFPEDIQKYLDTFQYIAMYQYGGVTEAFLLRLLNKNIWSAEVIDQSIFKQTSFLEWGDDEADCGSILEELRQKSQYVYERAYPERMECDGISFYQVKEKDVDTGTVYPIMRYFRKQDISVAIS